MTLGTQSARLASMKPFRWAADKNELLKSARGLCFEQIVVEIETGGLLDVAVHRNLDQYPRQKVFVVAFEGYAYLVPFVEEDDYYFLKTIIPSRRATREHLGHDNLSKPEDKT